MTRIELAPGAGEDLERILDHRMRHEVANAATRVGDIIQAIAVLERNPMIGRPVRSGLRELVIGQRSRGYVALYRHVPALDTVYVLATRGQREAGYSEKPE